MGLRKKKSLLDQAIDQASDYVDAAKPHVEAAYGSARDFVQDTAVPALIDAKDKAAPVIVDARDKATSKAAPLIASGQALAAEKATAAKTVADAKVAQLKGEPAPKKRFTLKKIVLFTALAGAVAFAAKKLQGGKAESNNWQSSYVPTPPPTRTQAPTPAPVGTPADDTGGSSPDEALADAAEAPHPVTTPDEPADVVDLEDPRA